MKKFNNYIILALSILVLNSCTKQLELDPLSEIGDSGFYTNNQEVEAAVVAIYDGLQNVPLREFAITEMRSDNTETKSSEGDWAQFESFNVQATNQVVGSYWTANYNVIFRANRVLENLDVVEGDQRMEFEGEALFARALAHFNLVRAYGDVPIVDKVIIQSDTDYFDRDPVSAVLAQCDADFSAAASLLPPDNGVYRASSGAAQALLAKVRLTAGDYGGAQTICESIVNSGTYALQDNYSDVFYNEGNSEVMFAIGYINDDDNESQDFSYEMTNAGAVSGLNYITADFTASANADDVERNDVLFSSVPKEVGKYLVNSADNSLGGNDWIVIRYADVLLMHTEAIMAGAQSTTNSGAIGSYNAVRERSGLSTLEFGETLTVQMLSDERRFELAFENHRLYDLVRMGLAQNVLSAFAAAEGWTFEPTDLLLPIPQQELNVSDGLLTQNPGY